MINTTFGFQKILKKEKKMLKECQYEKHKMIKIS